MALALPHRGETPIYFQMYTEPKGPKVVWEVELNKAVFEDVAALIASLTAELLD
jgi:hypothetical protein